MRIGLIGENPNDTDAIAILLRKQHKHDYISVLKRRTGGQLDNEKFTKLLTSELDRSNFDLLIFVRDLDGFASEENKIQTRKNWFDKNSICFSGASLLLLNIHELEAIFFADVDSLNKIFGLKLKFKNPLFIAKPKEELKKITAAKYHENRAAEYIAKLDYNSVLDKYTPLKDIDNYLKKLIMPQLTAITPMFWTKEIKETVAFYTEVLGFECALLEEGWAVLIKDAVEIMLSYPNEHVPFSGPQFTGSFYFNTTDVDTLWEAYKDKCNICYDIENFEYGMREFAIYDNNNYILQFGQPITE